MPQVRMRDAGNVLRTIARIRMRDAGNVLRTIQRIRMRDTTNALRTVWAYLTLTLDLAVVSGTNSGASASGTVISDTVTGTVTGGVAAFTYLWEYVSGAASIDVDSPTANSSTFSGTVSDSQSPVEAVYRLRVTDSTGAIAYSGNVTVQLTWIDTR
jgi:hypothetical protein